MNGSALGTSLSQLLTCAEIEPGSTPSYQTCKTILAYHPLGAKMTDAPIAKAQSQKRTITIQGGPEAELKKAFEEEWKSLGADHHIFNTCRLSRAYGVASLALLVKGVPANRPVDYKKLWEATIAFNVFDPLNTSGSLVLSQQPNDMDFQKVDGITVQGVSYHRSRSVVMLNEDPLYIEYTTSAFGYVGRSVYQRALFPLKSFIQTMVTDDMVSVKAGLLVMFVKAVGSVVNNIQRAIAGQKRDMLKEGVVGNVLQVGADDKVESIDLHNVNDAMTTSRTNIIQNIATAADMPAAILNQETFAEGFGEGTEDAKAVAAFVDRIREWMEPTYTFFDKVCMFRAWNPEFYKTIQAKYPEQYGSVPYIKAFYDWVNSFTATWPNLLEEPDSEKVKVDDVKLKAVIALLEVLLPAMDPENRVALIRWACDTFNGLKLLFPTALVLDWDALEDYDPAEALGQDVEPGEPKPFGAADSAGRMMIGRGPSVEMAKAAVTAAVAAMQPPPRTRRRVLDHA